MICAIETYALRKRVGDLAAIKMIAKAGFEGIDYSFYWGDDEPAILGEGYLSHAREVRAALDAHGLVCRQAHAPFSVKYGQVFDPSNPHYQEILRAMEAAALLGAEHIVVHAVGIPEEYGFVSAEDYNLEYYRSLEPYCAQFGMKIAVENLFVSDKKRGCYRGLLGTPEELCRLIRRLGSPHFVACVDLGHAALTGNEPELFLRRMDAELLAALHVQDNDYLGDRHVLPFSGKLNWDGITAALREKHYKGDLTLEVFGFLSQQPTELLPDALSYAASVAKYLASTL